MHRTLMGTAAIRQGMFFYYLLAGGCVSGRECYGILVEYLGEQAAVWNISSSKEAVESLLMRMQRGSVTPVSVLDVVEDWIL